MQIPSRRSRQRLLEEVFEQGVRHFDVARMYGLGAAEHELGRFARRRRDRISIATKFGIDPSGHVGRLARFQAPARAAVARLPALRAALKRRQSAFHQPRHYDVATALASLEVSLEALGTDYVDLLLIHDPRPGDRVDMAELGEKLEDLRRAGYVRAWGFSGELEPCLGLSDEVDAPTVLQVRDDILDPALARAGESSPAITFGVLSGSLQRVLRYLSSSEERCSSWSKAVGEDCGDAETVASLLLRDALDRNPEGTVLFSTTRPERVAVAVAAETVSREFESPSLEAFRKCVRADLGDRGQIRV